MKFKTEASVLSRLRGWRELFGKPFANGRANPDNDIWYLLLDAEESIAGLQRYATSLEKARDEHLRLKNDLVLKAYPAMDERDRLSAELAKAREALTGIRRAADHRRREADGERHEYYFHTADAALASAELQ